MMTSGYVLDWDLSALDGAGDDDANLASFLVLLAESLAANHGGLILTIPAARSTDNLAKGIANTPTVGVAVTEATAVRDFERFKVAQAAAAAQFGQTSMRNLWTGFTLSTKIWDPRPVKKDQSPPKPTPSAATCMRSRTLTRQSVPWGGRRTPHVSA